MTKKLNVLQFICITGFYGAERWVLALANYLDSKKFRCDLVITLEPNFQNMELVKKFKQNNGAAIELPMRHRFDFRVINQLCTLIKERQIDIIHTHGYKSDVLGILAAKKAGIHSVCTPHGFDNSKELKLRFFTWLGCLSMKYADKVAPLSRQLCEDAKRLGVKPENMVYIQNGIDLSEVENQRKKPRQNSSNEKRIGFIGQMINHKNINEILDVFAELHKKNKNLKLFLLGDGKQRQALEKYASTLACANNISFLGFRDDRLALLQSFDLFVMTSSLEGIPRCLMEALAMGVPVAAYDVAGINQLIIHQKTGLLAPFGDKSTLIKHCESLLNDPQRTDAITKKGRAFVEENYSAKRMASEYEALFQGLF